VPEGRAVTTWYYLADGDPAALSGGQPALIVDGQRTGPVINTVVMTHAAASYATGGRVLVSASCLGTDSSAEQETGVRRHLARLYGVSTDGWTLVTAYPIPYALPAMNAPLDTRKPAAVSEGLYVAGDHRDTASIQGAMVSGRRAAQAVLQRLGVGAAF